MNTLSQAAKNLIEEIDAPGLAALKAALEDGAALAILGIDDSDQDAVDEVHFWAAENLATIAKDGGGWIGCSVSLMDGQIVVQKVREVDGGYEWTDRSGSTKFVAEEHKRDLPRWAYIAITAD